MFQTLNLLFPKNTIEDTHTEAGRGDFIMTEGEFVMMLEIKNYTGNVNKTEIDKFYRDVKSENNHDITCAVFIRLRTGIANKPDFEFEVVNNKAAAPSFIPDEFPGVTVPSFRKTVFNFSKSEIFMPILGC